MKKLITGMANSRNYVMKLPWQILVRENDSNISRKIIEQIIHGTYVLDLTNDDTTLDTPEIMRQIPGCENIIDNQVQNWLLADNEVKEFTAEEIIIAVSKV